MKTKKTTTTMLKLQGVKIGTKCLYLEESEGMLRVGPTGMSHYPSAIARGMTKGLRRKLRKSLAANGHHDVMIATIPENQLSRAEQHRRNVLDVGDVYDDVNDYADGLMPDSYSNPGYDDYKAGLEEYDLIKAENEGHLKQNRIVGNGLNYATDGDASR